MTPHDVRHEGSGKCAKRYKYMAQGIISSRKRPRATTMYTILRNLSRLCPCNPIKFHFHANKVRAWG